MTFQKDVTAKRDECARTGFPTYMYKVVHRRRVGKKAEGRFIVGLLKPFFWGSRGQHGSRWDGRCWSSKALAMLEEEGSGGVLLQKSVPWERGDGVPCVEKAGADSCIDAETESIEKQTDAI